MRSLSFQINVEGAVRVAALSFAGKTDLAHYQRSFGARTWGSSAAVRDAIEFTRLAAKRWRYYAQAGAAAQSFAQLRDKIRLDPTSEISFIMIATLTRKTGSFPLGLAYCRRTWCHHLALDFLALHPSILVRDRRMRGVGSGIVFALVQLAEKLKIRRIWGEATVNSAAFYEKLLAVRPVYDLFVIEATEMTAIVRRQKENRTCVACQQGGL